MLTHKKKKKKTERQFIDKELGQKDLIYSVSIREMVESLDILYGKDRIVLTITIPYSLKQKILEMYPMFEDNKSAVLAYIMNAGISRTLEKWHAKET